MLGPPVDSELACPYGWTLYSQDQKCVRLFENSKTWTDAREDCMSNDGTLLAIGSESENNFVTKFNTAGTAWIGLKSVGQNAEDMRYFWPNDDDHDDGDYAGGHSSQPSYLPIISSQTKPSHCFTLETSLEHWVQKDCTEQEPYICERSAYHIAKKTCPEGWKRYRERCFIVDENIKMVWAQAKDYCESLNARLVTVSDSSVQGFLEKKIISNNLGRFWLGLHRINWKFIWSGSNASFIYSKWDTNKLDKRGKCVSIGITDSKTAWSMEDCDRNRVPICEKNVSNGNLKCDEGWDLNEERKLCTKRFYDKKTWNDARDVCKINGADLVNILDVSLNAYMRSRLGENNDRCLWIGLYLMKDIPMYVWSIERRLSEYTNFVKSDSNPKYGKDTCVCMSGQNDYWRQNTCSTALGYICQKDPYSSMKCPDTYSVFMTKKTCIKINDEAMTWEKARTSCRIDGGDLLTIPNADTNKFIRDVVSKVKGQYWVGLYNLQKDNKFQWLDSNKTVIYTYWLKGTPDSDTGKSCVMIDGDHESFWVNEKCTAKKNFICELPAPINGKSQSRRDIKTVMDCSEGGDGYYSKCYVIYGTEKSYSDSNATCKSLGGNLATINDRFVQAFIMSRLTSSRYWIGLNNIMSLSNETGRTTYPYVWMSGEDVHFTNWARDNSQEDRNQCVGINKERESFGLWRSYHCSTKMPYVCEYPRLGFTTSEPVVLSTTHNKLPCPDDWVGIGNMCYRAYLTSNPREEKNWMEANDYCRSLVSEGNLASMTNSDIEAKLKRLISLRYGFRKLLWIGLNDRDKEGDYRWADDQHFAYKNWAVGQPRNHLGIEDCVVWSVISNNWADYNCFDTLGYICQAPRGAVLYTTVTTPTVSPTATPGCGNSSWIVFQGNCYILRGTENKGDRKTWFNARDECRASGADLVSIRNEAENEFVASFVNRMEAIHRFSLNYIWIGLNDLNGDIYTWSDGSPAFYFSWLPGQPDDGHGGERCVRMKFVGVWTDKSCHSTLPYICKKKQGNVSPLISTASVPPKGGCPDKFFGVPGTTQCFYVGGVKKSEMKSFKDAGDACKEILPKSRLASIHSRLDEQFVTTLVSSLTVPAWIGLKAKYYWRTTHEDFVWVDNTRKNYVHWGPHQPVETNNGNKCVDLIIKPKAAGYWANVECTQKLHYVCGYRKDIKYSQQKINTTGCSNGYQRFRNSCYKYISIPKAWKQSEEKCVKDGGHLVSIQGGYDTAFIEVLTYSEDVQEMWIGLSKPLGQKSFYWTDGWPAVFTSWNTDQPDTSNSKKCVSHKIGIGWDSKLCSVKLPFVCEVDTDLVHAPTISLPGKCPNDKWTQFGGNCYYIESRDLKSWPGASFACRNMGSQLASINSREEAHIVGSLIALERANTWIGLRKIEAGVFEWSDDSDANYFNWAAGVQSDDKVLKDQSCALVQGTGGSWTLVDCFMNLGYVCKVKEATTASQAVTPKGQRENDLSAEEIAGITVGAVAFIAIFFLIAFFVIRLIAKASKDSFNCVNNPLYDLSSLSSPSNAQSETYIG